MDIIQAKVCNKCLSLKDISEFTTDKRNKDGKTNTCRLCKSKSDKIRRSLDLDKYRAISKIRYSLNKKYQKDYYKKRYSGIDGRKIRLYHNAKSRAKKEGLQFTLKVDDIIIPLKCPFLDIPFDLEYKSTPSKYTASIDRIDSSKGYTPDNIQVISWLSNTMKSNASKEDLITFSRNILKLYGLY